MLKIKCMRCSISKFVISSLLVATVTTLLFHLKGRFCTILNFHQKELSHKEQENIHICLIIIIINTKNIQQAKYLHGYFSLIFVPI